MRADGPRIAIVADYLNQRGGAEWVVAVLHELFPDAPIFTTISVRRHVGPPATSDGGEAARPGAAELLPVVPAPHRVFASRDRMALATRSRVAS